MDIWRIVWYPFDKSEKIHGVRLRETIKHLAEDNVPPVYGEVKNERGNRVELFCEADKTALFLFLERVKTIAKQKNKVSVDFEPPIKANDLGQWKTFNEMTVIRGDPFEEIDLAIRGAERLFQKLGDKIGIFTESIDKNRLKGVEWELTIMRGTLDSEDGRKAMHRVQMNAVKNFMAQPFDDELFDTCGEIEGFFIANHIKGSDPFTNEEILKLGESLDRALKIVATIKSQNGWKTNINSKREE